MVGSSRALLILCPLVIGCSGPNAPCFLQSSLIVDPRIIAVRVDPPESVADLTGEDPLTPSSLSALVVAATYSFVPYEYGRAVQVPAAATTTITVCLSPPLSAVNAQPGCQEGSEVVATLAAIPSPAAPFVYTPPLALLQAAADQDPLHGLTGIQIRLQIRVDMEAASVTATKVLSYKLKGSPESVNHAIELTGLEQSIDGEHTPVTGGLPVHLLVAKVTGLRPLIGPGAGATSAVESYLAYNNEGVLVPLQEHVTYAFYAGNALFFGQPHNGPTAIYTGAAGDVADEPAAGAPDPPDGLATVEGVFAGEQSGSFWIVARDGRGAEAWREQPYSATDSRPCGQGAPGTARCPAIFFGCN